MAEFFCTAWMEAEFETIDMMNQYSAKLQEYLTTNILPQMQNMLKNVSDGIFDVLIFMKNFLIGAIVALYVLADKEKFIAKSKMFVYAILPSKWANTLIHAMRFTDKTFGGFLMVKTGGFRHHRYLMLYWNAFIGYALSHSDQCDRLV